MAPMTRHKHAHTGLVTPQLPQLLLTAVLRMLAMLVLNVATTLQMIRRRSPVIGTQAMPSALPRETHDTFKETEAVQQDSHASPSPSVSLAPQAIHLPLLRMGRQTAHRRDEGELPPSVRSTGGGGLRALARKTEGEATRASPTPNKTAAA